MRRLVGIVCDESGTTAVEYCVMLGFIMLVLIGSVATFGSVENGKWGWIWTNMQKNGM